MGSGKKLGGKVGNKSKDGKALENDRALAADRRKDSGNLRRHCAGEVRNKEVDVARATREKESV